MLLVTLVTSNHYVYFLIEACFSVVSIISSLLVYNKETLCTVFTVWNSSFISTTRATLLELFGAEW